MRKKPFRETLAQTLARIDVEQFKIDSPRFSSEAMQERYQLSESRYFELVKQFNLGKYRPRKSLDDLRNLISKDDYLYYVQKLGVKGLCEHFDIDARQAKLLRDAYGIQLRKSPQTYEEFKNSIDLDTFIEYALSGKTAYSDFLGTKNNRFINRLLDELEIKKRKLLGERLETIDIEQFKADFAKLSVRELADKFNVGPHVIKYLMRQFNLKHTSEEKYSFTLATRSKANPDKTLDEILSGSARKANISKRVKGTSNTSTIESFLGVAFTNVFGQQNVVGQYYSEQYPFCCDYFIRDKELFIEVNGHFTHGYHPFNKNSTADLAKLALIKQKQGYYVSTKGQKKKNSYFSFERVWTEADPQKIDCALKNNLNYIMVYMNRNHSVEVYLTKNIIDFDYFKKLFENIFCDSSYKLIGIYYLEDHLNRESDREATNE